MLFLAVALILGPSPKFEREQAQAPRVVAARQEKGAAIAALFQQAKVAYPPQQMLLRAFKHEDELEVWVGDGAAPLVKLTTYAVCAKSGELGPKRQQGDLQVPEGFYVLNRFNAWSNFHLSLGLDYPNRSDRARATAKDPGGDIFIHGSCVTIGCIPIEDEPIKELYVMALDTFLSGRTVHVHVFPARMEGSSWERLSAGVSDTLHAFWEEIRPGYASFESTRRLPAVRVRAGAYQITPSRAEPR